MKNKKSALNLSINAIVILILAITMLGLGLTFMRGLFKQATTKVEAAVSAQELVNPPTVDSPLTVAPAEISVRSGKQDKSTAAFLNTKGTVLCQLDDASKGGGGTASVVLNKNPSKMTTDQINTWTISVTGTTEGTQLYTLTMSCGVDDDLSTTLESGEIDDTYTRDVVITITS